MEYGWGFAALMAGLLLTGLVFVVTGIQMACGRWRHALAGAAGLSEREREAAGVAPVSYTHLDVYKRQGEDVENSLLKLMTAADFDIPRAEIGIIYIDEIDKVARKRCV